MVALAEQPDQRQTNPNRLRPLFTSGTSVVNINGPGTRVTGWHFGISECPRKDHRSLATDRRADGFGNALGFTPSTAITQYLYAQQYYDLTNNTYYDWARNYDPTTGLFDQRDYGYSGSLNDPMSSLPYMFTGGDPINLSDLNGHGFSISETLGAMAINLTLDAIDIAETVDITKTIGNALFPAPVISAAQVPEFYKQLAELSYHVYKRHPVGFGPWEPAQHFQNGAFAAELYSNGSAYVLAFRGTEPNWADWYTNVAQAAAGPLAPTQYQEAVALAQRVGQSVGGAELTMTGHSLGGGLAAAAAIATGRSAVTFNAAGLNPLTVLDEGGLSFGGSVINYSVEGEILTELQSHTIAPEAFGTQYQIAPSPQDAGDSPIQLHSITSVLDALGL